jgi:SAM-dependent methyltransferase
LIPLSKVCDAADWFEPDVLDVIQRELGELPRFHRKQWEFAMVFRALKRLGLLTPSGVGLSMGGGRELLLYAVARHVRELVVTDLYDPHTTWAEARTDDPDRFIKEGKPFPVDDARLRALRMDMRQLEFPDETFDFAYSACAVEHIGEWADFLRHLGEVHRVLKPGGVYVFTTELHYGRETIEHPNNYVFSPDYLAELFAASRFTPGQDCPCAIAPHRANMPLPENLAGFYALEGDGMAARFKAELPHVQLLRGQFPHSSALFVLTRAPDGRRDSQGIGFPGLESSRDFLAAGIGEYRTWIESSSLSIDPLGYLPGRYSRFVEGEREPVTASDATDPTVFHSEYLWLGSGRRSFRARLEPARGRALGGSVEVRVHRYRTLGRIDVDCSASAVIQLAGQDGRPLSGELSLDVDPEYCYAFLGHMREGDARFQKVRIDSTPAKRELAK